MSITVNTHLEGTFTEGSLIGESFHKVISIEDDSLVVSKMKGSEKIEIWFCRESFPAEKKEYDLKKFWNEKFKLGKLLNINIVIYPQPGEPLIMISGNKEGEHD